MKKRRLLRLERVLKTPQKTWLAMKLSFIFSVLLTLNISVAVYSQQNRVSLDLNNVSLDEFIQAVKQQTGVHFLYNSALFENTGKVSVTVSAERLDVVLKEILENQGFTFDYADQVVVIRKAGEAAALPQRMEKRTVKGVVKDESGTTLPGVSVLVKGAQTGVATDINGHFEIRVNDDPNLELVFSFVGMKSKEVKVGKQENLQVILLSDTKSLEEVVVTGYQTISRERATGSFDILSSEQLDKPTTNIATRLVGSVSGVQATMDIDGNPKFEIRGQTSLYADAQPLVVVDGFAIEGDFSSINPNDVESVTILKDAAAASIWGARSANGVIVVTTKSGKQGASKGGVRVEISSFVKFAPKVDIDYARSVASSEEVVEYEKLAFNKWSGNPIPDGIGNYTYNGSFSPGLVALNENYLGYLSEDEMNRRLEEYKKYDNKEQIKKYLLQNPFTHQHNINISGNTERMSNMLSLLYEGNKTYKKGDENYKIMVNYKARVNLFKWLDFDFSGMYQYTKKTNNGIGIPSIAPYEMLINPDGTRTDISNGYYMPNIERHVPVDKFPYSDWTYNPITEMENREFTTVDMNARVQGGLTLKILEGLSIDSKIQYELYNTQNRKYYNEKTAYVRKMINEASEWNAKMDGEVKPNIPYGGILDQNRARTDVWYVRNQLNFNRVFAEKHAVNFVAGSEISDRVYQTYAAPTTYGYDDDRLTVGTFPNGPGHGSNKDLQIKNWNGQNQILKYTGAFTYKTDRFFSLYGNLAYTFDGKYTVSGSARTDASNLITDDPSYRYAPFWSVGASWQLSKENFMQKEWLDRLTVRVTYGYNGNVDKSTSFKPLINMGTTLNSYTDEYTASIYSFGNPTLRWEKTGTWDVGVDYSFFSGMLSGKLDVYNKSSKDLIATLSIPAINGTTSQKLNNAEMFNRGFEFEIGTAQKIYGNDISWRGNLNISYNKNRITKLFQAKYEGYNLIGGGTSAYVEGKDANTLWCYEYAGVYNDGTEANPNWQPKIKGPGDILFDFTGWPTGDGRDFCLDMGTKVAPWTLGFTNTFRIYDFDLSFIMTGKFGHKFMRQSFNYPVVWSSRVLPNKKLGEVLNGDPMKIVPLPMNGDREDRFYFWDRFYPYMSYLAVSANHVRMQEINLTYNMPAKVLSKIGIAGLQVYGQVNNVFSIYANKFKEDPEFPEGSMKPQPTYTFGLKLQF